MTTPLFTADGSLLPLLAGALALLFATVKAVMQRGNLRGLILWGALHDAGVACMALAAQNPAGQTGFWLFLLFQIAGQAAGPDRSGPARSVGAGDPRG